MVHNHYQHARRTGKKIKNKVPNTRGMGQGQGMN